MLLTIKFWLFWRFQWLIKISKSNILIISSVTCDNLTVVTMSSLSLLSRAHHQHAWREFHGIFFGGVGGGRGGEAYVLLGWLKHILVFLDLFFTRCHQTRFWSREKDEAVIGGGGDDGRRRIEERSRQGVSRRKRRWNRLFFHTERRNKPIYLSLPYFRRLRKFPSRGGFFVGSISS